MRYLQTAAELSVSCFEKIMKSEGISRYKLFKIGVESLKNSLRLHFDSILLYENESYPSAFQLSVLALEEFSKAKSIEHYVWSSEWNDGYPDAKFEQEWLKLLYLHPSKQWSFVARELYDYSPKFLKFIKDRKLEEKKQNSIYVGLSRHKGGINISSRVSTPERIKKPDATQIISLVNSEFIIVAERAQEEEPYFEGIPQMNSIFESNIYQKLLLWPHKSGLKSSNWWKVHRKNN
jgi:AbiV family abortive infection protein